MNREIKFRAWDDELLKMSKPFTFGKVLNFANEQGIGHYKSFRDDQHTPMQYTGRKDLNGKEIYEGDRCKCCMVGFETHIEEVETEVYYDESVGGFGHKVTSEDTEYVFFGLNSSNLIDCQIIGNIYETPSAQ